MQSKKDLCKKCLKNCCGDGFLGLSNSFKTTNNQKFCQILLSEEEAGRIKEFCGGSDSLLSYEDVVACIKLNADNSCPAFKNGVCQIYSVRPDVCRLYPFYFDPFCGICVDKNCPYFNEEDRFDKKEIFEILKRRINLFEKIDQTKKDKQ